MGNQDYNSFCFKTKLKIIFHNTVNSKTFSPLAKTFFGLLRFQFEILQLLLQANQITIKDEFENKTKFLADN